MEQTQTIKNSNHSSDTIEFHVKALHLFDLCDYPEKERMYKKKYGECRYFCFKVLEGSDELCIYENDIIIVKHHKNSSSLNIKDIACIINREMSQ